MNPSATLVGITSLGIALTFGDCSAAQRPQFRAGAAAVDISPQRLPAIMNGGFLQNHANRIVDPLHARSLVLNDGTETIALVIVDSCMFPRSVCDEIKRLVTEQTGIAQNRILISATHTHTAPSVMDMCLGTGADSPYLEYVPSRVAQSVAKAHKNLRPAKIGWAIVDGSDLTNCRRWITRRDQMGTDPFGGRTVRAMMHPGYQNPNYSCPAGPIDPWLSVLSVASSEDETPICVMANLSMHYFGGGGFSADYFGEVARQVETSVAKNKRSQSPPFVGIMSQGTSGDLHWMDYSSPRRNLSRSQYSQRVSDRILKALGTIKYELAPSLGMAEKRLVIGRRTPSRGRREWARPINAARGQRPPRDRTEVYAQQAEWIHENPHEEIVLQVVRIGELGITAIPNEVYGVTGLKLKSQSPLPMTFNLELANGAAGYIPPPEQHRLGGYTTWPARTAGLGESAEPQIVETLLHLMEHVSGKPRRQHSAAETPYSRAVAGKKPVAYWRLDDMSSSTAHDTTGRNHGEFHGPVALFLPQSNQANSPKGFIGQTGVYGNRCVYLAGGHVAAKVPDLGQQYSASVLFYSDLPLDREDTSGALFANASETLLISGEAAGTGAGKLVLEVDGKSWKGKTPLSSNHWQHLVLIRQDHRIRVFLDGKTQPEIDVTVTTPKPSTQWFIGCDRKSARPFDGKVDEAFVMDHELTEADIRVLYEKTGLTPPPIPKPVMILGPKPQDSESRKQYADAVLASKPVAYWRLHDLSSQTASDSAGQHPATYSPGAAPLSPGSATPNFTGGRVKSDGLNLGNTYSVELWFRNEIGFGARPVTGYLFSRAIDNVHGADGDNLGIGGTHSNSGRLIVFNGNQRDQLLAGKTPLARGGWSHVVMVRENQRITVYLNGEPTPEIVGDLPIGYPKDCNQLFFGGRADNFANLSGMLEELAIYNRAVKPEEVTAHFQAAGVQQIEKPIAPQAETPTPTKASDALKTIQVPKGFSVELVASEPVVKDPVAIDWGPDGRLWVVEMADYPLGTDGKGKPGGRVRFLEDTNQDGQYDKSTLLADGLSFPTGVLAWGGGVLVTAAPQILYLEDTTGDGKADVRQVLYSGFLEGNQQLRVNGLRWGLDNWVYCASGSHHGGYGKDSQILSHVTGKKHHVGSRDFRIRPDSGEMDPQSGPSQNGRNRDDWGNWFGVQNSHPLWHYVLSDHHIRRNPHFAPPDPRNQVVTPTNPRVYPASQLQKRFHSFSQSGRFTSACSAMIYRDDYLLPRGRHQHAFTCEPFHNLVQHNQISDQGVSFSFSRDRREKQVDFFASQDRWCRPVMARTGPDGALWIVDMYRYMIEHPQWLPQNGRDELKPWYRSGEGFGRIYRVVRDDHPAGQIPRFTKLSSDQLASRLESSNGWQRDVAQRLLVRGKGRASVESLRALATNSDQPLARLHALWTLHGLTALPTDVLVGALAHKNAGLRRNAVRIAASHPVDIELLAALANDPDAKVRLELATTLGNYDSPLASQTLAQLAIRWGENHYMTAAVMSSLNPENVYGVLSAAIESSQTRGPVVTKQLIQQAIAMADKKTIQRIVQSVAVPLSEQMHRNHFETISRILDGLAARSFPIAELSQSAQEPLRKAIDQARSVVADQEAAIGLRAAAARLLAKDSNKLEDDFAIIRRLLGPQTPILVQQAVVENLAGRREPNVAEILLAGWRQHSPSMRNQILDTCVSRKPWAEVLIARLESGTIRPDQLTAAVRGRLLSVGGDAPRWKLALDAKESTDRADVFQQFKPALKLPSDSRRGEASFRKLCMNCHKLGDEGHEVGPQLASITDKTKKALYASILDPDGAVDAKYFNYRVVTIDGRVLSGRLETETGSSITLLAAGGQRHTVLRRDIETLQASGNSVMPTGIEKELTPQGLADLIEFVQQTFR